MKVTLKLFATLSGYLPPEARQNAVELDVEEGTTPMALLERFGVPREAVHLVLLNGVFITPDRRIDAMGPGDVLAVWPPVAGG